MHREKKFLNMQECLLHWVFLNYFILAVSIEEIVVDHELAKDTLRGWHPLYSWLKPLREVKSSSSYQEFKANNQK